MEGIIALLNLILAVLGWLAAPVSIVWLAVLGEWWAIGCGVLSIFSPLLLWLVMTPGMLLAIPAFKLQETRPHLAVVLALPHQAYMSAVVTVWCMGVFTFLVSRAGPTATVPMALLAFAVGTWPFEYMTSHDLRSGGGEASLLNTMFMNIAFVVAGTYHLVGESASWSVTWALFGAVMVVGLGVTSAMGHALARARL